MAILDECSFVSLVNIYSYMKIFLKIILERKVWIECRPERGHLSIKFGIE